MSDETTKEGAADEEQESYFEDSLFLNKSYKKRTISCGGHEICIMVSESASTDYDLTGQVIWPCASHLCKYVIDKRSEFEGKTVLEVGSGVGICGLFAGLFASTAVVTDNNDVVMELLRQNVDLVNSSYNKNITAEVLDWGKFADINHLLRRFPLGFDCVIGSDVVYWPSAVEPLFLTLSQLLLKEDSYFLLCYQSRSLICDQLVLTTADKYGFDAADFLQQWKQSNEPIRFNNEEIYGEVSETFKSAMKLLCFTKKNKKS